MSFNSEYLELRERRKKKENENKAAESIQSTLKPASGIDDIAPFVPVIPTKVEIKPSVKTKQDEQSQTYFQKGGFDDGYDSWDVTKTILGTVADVGVNLLAGLGDVSEGLLNTGAAVVGKGADLFGNDKLRKSTEEFIMEDKVPGAEDVGGFLELQNGYDVDKWSVLGEKSDALVQSGGQMLTTAALQSIGVPWWLTTGVTSFGGKMSEALNEGATYDEALFSSAVTAGAEILTEKLSGGVNFGGKTLDDVLTQRLATAISNRFVRNAFKLGMDGVGEGLEEVLSEGISNFGEWLSYRNDEELSEVLASKEALDSYMDSFIGGTAIGGLVGSVKAGVSAKKGVDYTSQLTSAEEKVVNSIYENRVAESETDGKKLKYREKTKIYDAVIDDLEKGYIDIDTIESALGGETYNKYKSILSQETALQEKQKALQEQLKELENASGTVGNIKKFDSLQSELSEIEKQLNSFDETTGKSTTKSLLADEVFGIAKGSRLIESYNERARKGEAFDADITKYDEKQQEVVKKAIDSGILNNTRRTHEFVDMVAKISADKGVLFDFTNNQKLKESGFSVDGKVVNGFVQGDNITLNIDSSKALNTTVGHEITHILEDADVYAELQNMVKQYATAKGEYDKRYKALEDLYKGVEGANIENELTADLVGEYLFTDSNFINNLSTEKPNLFKRIYNEIKYLCRVATAGSKEARQLEKVKKTFEDAYRQKNNTDTENGGVRYSIGNITSADGTDYGVGVYLDSTLLDNLNESERKQLIKEYIKELGGKSFTAYDGKEEIKIKIAKANQYFKNRNGKWIPANKDLSSKFMSETKQEAVVLVNELVDTASYENSKTSRYTHGWLDNDGKNNWDYWNTYIVDKNNIIWSAKLNIANTENGEKVLYDIGPIKKVGSSVKSDITPTNNNISQSDNTVNNNSMQNPAENAQDGEIRKSAKGSQGLDNSSFSLERSTNIKFSLDFDKYPYNMQTVIKEYIESVDKKLLDMVEETKNEEKTTFKRYTIGNVSQQLKDDIMNQLNIDVTNYVNAVNSNAIQHIITRHGENGKSDNSMSNSQDIARMGYVMENYDSFEVLTDKNGNIEYSEEFRNADNTKAPMIRLSKKINGTYYVINAVPEGQYKKIWVVSAYISKGSAVTQAPNNSGSYLASPSSANTNISQENDGVNNNSTQKDIKYALSEDGENNSHKQKQLEIINESNPAPNTYNTWVRSIDDIKTFEEAVLDPEYADYDEFNPDFTRAMAEDALESGEITVYSSYPISNGTFVTPSRMEAESYSGSGQVYEKTVALNDVAWIDATQGQYAKVDDTKFSVSEQNEDIAPIGENSTKYSVSKVANADEILYNKDNPLSIVDRATTKNGSSIGWVYDTKIFSIVENKLFHEKISEINQGSNAFSKAANGEYMIPIENKIVFTDGNYDSPQISEIVEVLTDNATEFDVVKETICGVEAGKLDKSEEVRVLKEMFGSGAIISYKSGNGTVYGWEDGRRKGKTRRAVIRNYINQQIRIGNGGKSQETQVATNVATFSNGENTKSALSIGNDIAPVGDYRVYGKDVALEKPNQNDDIAPAREISVKEQLKANNNVLNQLDIVDSINEDKIFTSKQDVAEWALKKFEKTGFKVKRKGFGEIIIDKRRIKKGLSYLKTNEERLALAAVPKVLSDGIQIGSHTLHKGRPYNTLTFAAPVEINGQRGNLAVVVRQEGKNYYKVHRLVMPDGKQFVLYKNNEDIAETVGGVENDSGLSPTDNIFNNSISQTTVNGQGNSLENDIDSVIENASEAKTQAAADESLADLNNSLDDIAPVSDTTANEYAEEVKGEKKEPVLTVKDRNAAKLRAYETEFVNNNNLRKESLKEYNQKIAELQTEYAGKKDKYTKVAHDILRRIERLQRLRDVADATYEKRLNDLKAKINKMNSKEFKTAEQRMMKQQELKEWAANLIGDTTSWVDKKLGLSYKVNTLRRNLRDIVRDGFGNRDIQKADAIYEELQGKYNHNEAELNREATRIKEPFAKMAINRYENEYIQMLGELRHNPSTTLDTDIVREYLERHRDKIDEAKVDKAIEMAREAYDSLIIRVNEVLRSQGMKEIAYRKGYFPHFTEEKQGALAKLFNWKTKNDEIPTDIAGLTENFNPNRSWQSFNKRRKGDTTDYNFLKGLDMYVQGSLDWIYHIEDIQKRRAVENHIRYVHSEKGIQERIDAINNNDTLSAEEMQEQIDLVYKEAGNPLNNFITDFRTQTNTLAGKKSSMDRGMEEFTNRKFYSAMTNLSNRVTANMVGGSISSALTNFIPITQSWGQVSPISSLRAMGETLRSTFRDDGTINKSDFLTNRLRQAENLYQTKWDKVSDKVGVLMDVIDSFTSQTVWRSKFNENISNGMSEAEAVKNADQFAENVLAGRSRGNNPTIFDSKNPLIKTLTAFQLEVNNQYGYMFKDMPQDMRNESKIKLVKGYATMFIGAYAYNMLYSALTGRDAAFDPLGIIMDLFSDLGFGDDDDEEEEVNGADVVLNLADNILEELPFVSGLVGGGRVPISSALPYGDNIKEAFEGTVTDIAEGNLKHLFKEYLSSVGAYVAIPVAGGQLRKTAQGIGMYSDEHPIAGSYTDSGKLRFTAGTEWKDVLQSALFGQYSSATARQYFDENRTPLSEKQIKELIDVGIPIEDYWKYRDGLKKQKELEDKFEYINGLNLSDEQKNVLANNQNHIFIVQSKKDVDMSNYDDFDSYDEFDFYSQNTDKYNFLQKNGISYDEYKSSEDAKEKYDSIYSWYKNNPEKVAVAKAVTSNVVEYRGYASALSNIRADKDRNGNTIAGSAKEKKLNYINSLQLDYGAKMILFKREYPDDDTYNYDIIEYLKEREDISYDEMVAILKELGFKVSADGTIYWD